VEERTIKAPIRVPESLHDEIKAAADEDSRSTSMEYVALLKYALRVRRGELPCPLFANKSVTEKGCTEK